MTAVKLRSRLRSLVKGVTPAQGGDYLIATNEYGSYCVPAKASHRPACRAILRGEVYERETIRFLCDQAEGDIVHGGTFFGDFLPAISRAYELVWAFEPNPDSFKCAEITIRLNDLANVNITNAAMGRAEGRLSLRTEHGGEYLGGGSFIVDEPGETPVVPLDSIIPPDRHIGMIHLDVERFEGPALEGARRTIERCRPTIVLETVPEEISNLGYREVGTVNRNRIFKPA